MMAAPAPCTRDSPPGCGKQQQQQLPRGEPEPLGGAAGGLSRLLSCAFDTASGRHAWAAQLEALKTEELRALAALQAALRRFRDASDAAGAPGAYADAKARVLEALQRADTLANEARQALGALTPGLDPESATRMLRGEVKLRGSRVALLRGLADQLLAHAAGAGEARSGGGTAAPAGAFGLPAAAAAAAASTAERAGHRGDGGARLQAGLAARGVGTTLPLSAGLSSGDRRPFHAPLHAPAHAPLGLNRPHKAAAAAAAAAAAPSSSSSSSSSRKLKPVGAAAALGAYEAEGVGAAGSPASAATAEDDEEEAAAAAAQQGQRGEVRGRCVPDSEDDDADADAAGAAAYAWAGTGRGRYPAAAGRPAGRPQQPPGATPRAGAPALVAVKPRRGRLSAESYLPLAARLTALSGATEAHGSIEAGAGGPPAGLSVWRAGTGVSSTAHAPSQALHPPPGSGLAAADMGAATAAAAAAALAREGVAGVVIAKRRANLTREQKDVFRAWFVAHLAHPYPTDAQKSELAQAAGTTVERTATWFINARQRDLRALLAAGSSASTDSAATGVGGAGAERA
jgi:hypothetical protein